MLAHLHFSGVIKPYVHFIEDLRKSQVKIVDAKPVGTKEIVKGDTRSEK